MGGVRRWRDGSMVLRWAASALMKTGKRFKKIMGYRNLWQLEAHLKLLDAEQNLDQKREAG